MTPLRHVYEDSLLGQPLSLLPKCESLPFLLGPLPQFHKVLIESKRAVSDDVELTAFITDEDIELFELRLGKSEKTKIQGLG